MNIPTDTVSKLEGSSEANLSELEQPANKSIVVPGLIAAFAAILLFFLNYFLTVPALYGLSPKFSYQADVLSLDNFFDEMTDQFLGEARSVTTFGYAGVEERDEGVVVDNFFDVRTVGGDQIVKIERDYGIDPTTWQHTTGIGSKDREGYLFAPRHLRKGENFSYWHVNYDTQLDLQFEATEVINGLTLYRYGSSFDVDQTQSLSHLPGVPDERGVNLDVTLTMWVEPVTGWLVKYEDSAIAYYYDAATGERLHPWNKFSNRYRQASVVEQVRVAAQRRLVVLIFEWVLPVFAFFFIIARLAWKRRRKLGIISLTVGVVAGTALIVWLFLPFIIRQQDEKILVGIARWAPYGNESYDENIQGFKDALTAGGYIEGENVAYDLQVANANADTQQEIADQFSKENVSLVFSQTTSGTLILKDSIPHRPIIFSIVTYPVESGLIESLQNSGNNLVGTRNWVPVEDQLSVFLKMVPNTTTIGFVHREGELNSLVQLEEMRKASEPFGITVESISGRDLQGLIDALSSAKEIDALYSACDTLVQSEAEEVIIAFAHERRLPSFSCNITGPQKGDLIGVVSGFYQLGRLSGEQAILVLEGATPSSLETLTETQPQVHVNATTAALLDLTIPQDVLVKVDTLIE